jgi:2-methylisocitrate lyase-like PEP mutase family enzyme
MSPPSAIERFRALHHSGCFVMPNAWDVGSAVFLAHLGFPALASTSAGFAFTRGLPDEVTALALDDVLLHLRELAAATTLPVHADFQNGYAHEPEGVARNVTRCLETGVAGLSIEDATGERARPLYERDLALERVRAARAAIDAAARPVHLTARCEAWLVGDPEPARTALDRLVAYAEAGADCLFAPLADLETLATLVRAVAPKPVNAIVSTPAPGVDLARLAELGVRRISVGSALARTAWNGFVRAARLLKEGSFAGLAEATSFDELNRIFER